MRTRYIPGIVMLTAGLITSIICLVKGYEIIYSLSLLLVVMIIFAIIGFISKKIIENQIREYQEQEEARLEEEKLKEMELIYLKDGENETNDEEQLEVNQESKAENIEE